MMKRSLLIGELCLEFRHERVSPVAFAFRQCRIEHRADVSAWRPAVAPSVRLEEREAAAGEYIRHGLAIGNVAATAVVVKHDRPPTSRSRRPQVALEPQV